MLCDWQDAIGKTVRFRISVGNCERFIARSKRTSDGKNCKFEYGLIVAAPKVKDITSGVTNSQRILVVDDEPWSLEFICDFLRKEGYEVTQANDGAEAIELMENSQFDLVLSDVRMPHLDGVALVEHVRSKIPTLPIILMTGVASDLTPKLYNVPCLSKPLSLADLRSNIERLL
jgi:two-component system cell cycle response regulator CpdR